MSGRFVGRTRELGLLGKVVVSLSGAHLGPDAVDLLWTAEDVVAAWR